MDHLNKITRPYINDALALTELSENKKASSYPQLLAIVDIVHLAYAQYEAVGGNAFAVAPVTLSAQANNYLKGHYKSPVKGLSHINTLRLSQEHLTCPMCGSTHRGTLDHLLPQASHPTFAIFSLNLVPACKCNSNRNDRLLGDNPGERILHPYFDGCLSMRLIRAKFEDLGPVPRISVDLCIPATHPDYAAVSFHVRTVVKSMPIVGYLNKKWAHLYRKPSLAVRALAANPRSITALKTLLLTELLQLDDEHGGKNNWNSMFVAGLLDRPVLTWLFQSLNEPGRKPNARLG